MTKEMEVLRQENKHNLGGTNIEGANKKNMHNKVCNLPAICCVDGQKHKAEEDQGKYSNSRTQ